MKYEKEYSKQTLMSMPKKWLVDYILMLIDNNNILHETIDQQAKNCEQLLLGERNKVVNEYTAALFQKCTQDMFHRIHMYEIADLKRELKSEVKSGVKNGGGA